MATVPERALAAFGQRTWAHNWSLCGRELMGEITSRETGDVWLCQEPFTAEEYRALAVPDGFRRSGLGRSAHDAAFFRRSPGAAVDGPVDTMAVDGRVFARVARPGPLEPGFEGVFVLPVEKHHVVMFEAGRTIEVMDFGDGFDHVPQITELVGLPSVDRVLPAGWSVRTVTLAADLVVELPTPARVCFFRSGHSFHGPVRLDLD